eukprot:6187200-Prymnesium_polylepis.1
MSRDAWAGGKWSKESERFYTDNFAPNANAVSSAREAGAQRFAFVGVASIAETGLSGTNPGMFKGKRDAAAAARAEFGSGATCFGPHLVVGRRDARLKALDSGWARGLIALNKAVGEVGYRGEDFITRTSLPPPVSVDDLALAIAATMIGAVEVDESERLVTSNDGGDSGIEIRESGRFVDGTAAIKSLARVAEAAGVRLA